MVVITAIGAGTTEAQAHTTKITAPTPGLQIVQLRAQISHDMFVIKHRFREVEGPKAQGWLQIIHVVIAQSDIDYHTQHLAWATKQLQRRWALLGDVRAWGCIHYNPRVGHGEGAWNDPNPPYWGGLQMDLSFQRHYGLDMMKVYGGTADRWHPYDQIIVAERARRSGRGYYPWPNTARACGLI